MRIIDAYNILAEISRKMPEQCSCNDGFMFTDYGYAVYEKELDDGRFEYTALNLLNGARLTLERRKNPVTNAALERLVCKLRDSRIAGLGKLEVSGDVPLSKLKMVLTELFHEILPHYGYSIRDGQIELAEQLLGAMAGRKVLLAEASTGLGKTLVYILVGALVKRSAINQSWSGSYFPEQSCVEWHRMPILISTSSIALQKSVLDYIKEISKILMENGVIKTPLRVSLKKGWRNYVCEHNLRSYIPYERNPDVSTALRLILFRGDIDLAEIEGLTKHIKSIIAVPTKCYKNCPYEKDCRYVSFREMFDDSEYDFIVTNHNLLLVDAKLRAEGKCTVLPPVQMYVIDEAHQLSNVARSIYGAELSNETIPEIVKNLLELNFTPHVKRKSSVWREVRDAVNILGKQLLSLNEQLFSMQEADSGSYGFLSNIRTASDYLQKILRESHKFNVQRDEQIKYKLIAELERLSEDANALFGNDEQLRWFERERNESVNLSLCGLPKRLNDRLYADLWKRGVPTLLTSGTLSANGDFNAFKRATGISKANRIIETIQPSPYDYRKNCLLYLSNKVPYPRQSSKIYISALTDEVERLIKAAHGHTAVLFTSYNVMGRVHKNLEKRSLSFPLFKLEQSTSNAIDRFKESGNGVLFATGALWEGIDIPGDALSMLIIVKLPFAVPDRVSEYEQTQYPNFMAYLESVLTPEMLVKLKQGAGRLIRLESDTGVVAILDIRTYFGNTYHGPVIATLPPCHVTDDINEVEDFIQTVKEPEYFE